MCDLYFFTECTSDYFGAHIMHVISLTRNQLKYLLKFQWENIVTDYFFFGFHGSDNKLTNNAYTNYIYIQFLKKYGKYLYKSNSC
jgi:hypothetical protein